MIETRDRSSAAPLPHDTAIRELVAVREIAHAFLTADRPQEVFQFALDRVSPLLGASFASVYVIDGEDDVMQLAAAYNWPERFRPFLGEMRVRLGSGPSGQAAGERRIVRVPDVFADEMARDWWDIAHELGFRALVAVPLQTPSRVVGALTFYFAEAPGVRDDELGLLRTVGDQMAATAEKASMIHELRRANAALHEANGELERQYLAVVEARRLKDEFLSNMSHELRTPLTAVVGYAYLLQEGLAGPLTSDQRATLGQMTGASERLLALIDDLLELTAVKRGDVRITIETFDPRDVLRDAVAAARGCPATVRITADLPEGAVPWMRSDRRKITKILDGFLGNAFKFTEHGEVRASVRVGAESVRFAVTDTGIGISASDQELVFDEFRQVDGSATRTRGGSGLGLALAQRLAELLGGHLELESAPAEGSTFTVELPLEYMPELSTEAPPDR